MSASVSSASALQVSPAAIYHHFESRDDIVLAALGLVWEEVFAEILTSTTDFVPDDPRQFLIDGALATRPCSAVTTRSHGWRR